MVPGALCVSPILDFDHSDPQVKNYLINTKFLAVSYRKQGSGKSVGLDTQNRKSPKPLVIF